MTEGSGESIERENGKTVSESVAVEELLDSLPIEKERIRASTLNARDIYSTSWIGRIEEKEKGIEGILPKAEDVVIHVHGWRNSTQRGKTNTEDMRKAYNGRDNPVVGLLWPSDDTWWNAKKLADRTGRKLAEFLVEHHRENPEASIRLQGHSLGCRVVSETVHSLHSMGETSIVDEVLLLGGAVHCSEVGMEGRYGQAFEESVDEVWSFFFRDDVVLKWLGFYERSDMIGRKRCGGKLPENFIEVEFDAEHHRGYYRERKIQEILSIIE